MVPFSWIVTPTGKNHLLHQLFYLKPGFLSIYSSGNKDPKEKNRQHSKNSFFHKLFGLRIIKVFSKELIRIFVILYRSTKLGKKF